MREHINRERKSTGERKGKLSPPTTKFQIFAVLNSSNWALTRAAIAGYSRCVPSPTPPIRSMGVWHPWTTGIPTHAYCAQCVNNSHLRGQAHPHTHAGLPCSNGLRARYARYTVSTSHTATQNPRHTFPHRCFETQWMLQTNLARHCFVAAP